MGEDQKELMKLLKAVSLFYPFLMALFLLFFIPCGEGTLLASSQEEEAVSSHPLLAASESVLDIPNSERMIIEVPFLGKIDPEDYSLPALAVTLGLIDGFNPCAMWALVYLISLVGSLNDRRKIWLIVGTFVLSSGVLYFLFMSAWLNAFIFIGYFRPITVVIGFMALYAGLSCMVDLVKSKGVVACKVVDDQTREKTMSRMKRLALSPLTLSTVLSIIALAFIVNSIEFLCSCAIPAIFTHVLSISSLSWKEFYGYILLYDLFFMLDDLIIFGSAAFAFNAIVGSHYVVYCRILGGVLMTVLGFLLIFMPHVLMMK
jgi:hypothetical protein